MTAQTLIDPTQVPGRDVHVDRVADASTAIASRGRTLLTSSTEIGDTWKGLPAAYSSTGAESVYTAMDPVTEAAGSAATALALVSIALDDWVTAVRPIKKALDAIVTKAHTLHHDVKNFQGEWTQTNNWAISFGTTWVDSWQQDPTLNDRNNKLIGEAYVLGDQLRVADENLMNAIRKASGLAAVKVAPAVKSAPDAVQTTWGIAGARQESCLEKTAGFQANALQGIGNGAWNLVSGLGELLTGYDFHSWPPPAIASLGFALQGNWKAANDTNMAMLGQWGQSWVGFGQLATGVAGNVMLPLVSQVVIPLNLQELKSSGQDKTDLGRWEKSLYEGMQDWTQRSQGAVLNVVGSLGDYHVPGNPYTASGADWAAGASDWTENPGNAAGESVFNIASFLLPVKGGGSILDALKGLKGGAGATEALGHAGQVVEDGGHYADSVTADGVRGANGIVDDAGARLAAIVKDADGAGAASDALDAGTHSLGQAGSDLGDRLTTLHHVDEPAPPPPARAPDVRWTGTSARGDDLAHEIESRLRTDDPPVHPTSDTPSSPVHDAPAAHGAPADHGIPADHGAPTDHGTPADDGTPADHGTPSDAGGAAHDHGSADPVVDRAETHGVDAQGVWHSPDGTVQVDLSPLQKVQIDPYAGKPLMDAPEISVHDGVVEVPGYGLQIPEPLYDQIMSVASHDTSSGTVVFGKFNSISHHSYIERAQDLGASYFSMGDLWDAVSDRTGLQNRGMFDYFNSEYLRRAAEDGKQFYFSDKPEATLDSGAGLERDWLIHHDYDIANKPVGPYYPVTYDGPAEW